MGEAVRDRIVALCAKVNEYRLGDDYCDVDIRVQEETFKCHRLILGAASEYFHFIFSGDDFKENSGSVIIIITETSPDIFKRIIQLIYTGDVSISNVNLLDLLRASQSFQIPGLESACIDYMRENPPVDNVSEIFSFCNTSGRKQVAAVLQRNIFDNIDSVSRTSDFLNILFDDLKEIFKYVTCYKPSNRDVFHRAALRWVKYANTHSAEERKGFSNELFSFIDYGKLSYDYINYSVEGLICDFCPNVPIRNRPTSSSAYGEMPHSEIEKAAAEHRCLHAFILTGYKGNDEFTSSSIFTCYREVDNVFKWIHSYSFGHPLPDFMRTVELDNNLFCLNYTTSGKQYFFMSSSISLSPKSYLNSPPIIIDSFDMCRMNEYIYIYDRDPFSDLVYNSDSSDSFFDEEELSRGILLCNTEINCWLPVPPLREKFANACMTSDEKMLYLIGGTDSNNFVQGYDHRTEEWQTLPTTSGMYEMAACCVSKGKIYVSGGYQNPMKVEVYDPVAGKWEDGPNMSRGRFEHEMLVDESGACITYDESLSCTEAEDVLRIDGTWSSCLYNAVVESDLSYKTKPFVCHMTLFKPYGW